MKALAGFGQFVIDTWAIWVAVFSVVLIMVLNYVAPPTVTLDGKHWECTMAVPDGISTRCTEYNYRGK